MASKILTLQELEIEQKRPMPAHQWVNKLSWRDIGNRDEAQRKEFVALVKERDEQIATYVIARYKLESMKDKQNGN